MNSTFTITADTTVAPYNYILTYYPAQFTRSLITGSAVHYNLVISITDSVSADIANTYTIAVTIDNTNHAPVLAAGKSLTLDGWTIGHYLTPSLIPASLFSDPDGDTPSVSTCSITSPVSTTYLEVKAVSTVW
jgi:hypothetical protein